MQLDPGSIDLGDMGVLTLAFSPDGKQLLAGGPGSTAVWSTAPVVWNDPVRAAEKLRLLLQSNVDFQSRIRMLSQHARLYEALEKLERLAPNDVRVQIALAVARVRRFGAQGNAALADAARAKARLLLEQKLAQEPDNSPWAAELADLLLIDNPARWTILKPVEAKSELGATLSILPDESILASGANPLKDRYRVVLTVANQIDLTAVRLEALTHPSLPGNGPGRCPGGALGSFAQSWWKVIAASPDRKDPITLQFDNAWADHQYGDYPIRADGHWNIYGSHGANCTAIWSVPNPVPLAAGTTLTFEMQCQEYTDSGENLGHFRLSVSSDPSRIEHSAAIKLTDPWAKLAAAYHLVGDQKAFDSLLNRHPAAGAGIGDLYAAAKDWERAIAEYRKAVTDQPADSLLTKLATTYQSAGRTREACPLSGEGVRRQSAGHDALPEGRRSPGVVRTGQGTRCHPAADPHVRQGHRGVRERPSAPPRSAVSFPVTEKAELEAALALARKGVELGKGEQWQEWNLLALGMAEYRSGNYAAADEALLAAAKAGANNAIATGISAFYRAMSLFRQGKPDEARKLAIAATAKMKPLPKDEQNPFANGAYYDDLILWLAYKEAKAMIHFDAAPTDPATPDGK